MKVVLFCGGAGMRLRGYSEDVPKPMVTVGSRPMLWHIMKYYAHFGHKDFILCLGYKANVIKNYFLEYEESVSNDFIFSQGGRKLEFMQRDIDDWNITFVDTGLRATIADRLRFIEPFLGGDDMFLANYSDGLTSFYLPKMIQEFSRRDSYASFLSVQPRSSSLDTVQASAVVEIDIGVAGGNFQSAPTPIEIAVLVTHEPGRRERTPIEVGPGQGAARPVVAPVFTGEGVGQLDVTAAKHVVLGRIDGRIER